MISFFLALVFSSLAFHIHSFYVNNAAIIEKCTSQTDLYLNKFDSTKMRCFEKTVRQVALTLECTCKNGMLKPTWSLQITNNQHAGWPSEISVFTATDLLTQTTKLIGNANKLIIIGNPVKTDASISFLTTYIWAAEPDSPECRMNFRVNSDCAGTVEKTFTGQLTNFVCYNGKKRHGLNKAAGRNAFDIFLSDHLKDIPNKPSNLANGSSAQQNSNNTATKPSGSGSTSARPLAVKKSKKKNQLPIIVGAGVGVAVIVVVVVVVVIWRHRVSKTTLEQKLSITSDME